MKEHDWATILWLRLVLRKQRPWGIPKCRSYLCLLRQRRLDCCFLVFITTFQFLNDFLLVSIRACHVQTYCDIKRSSVHLINHSISGAHIYYIRIHIFRYKERFLGEKRTVTKQLAPELIPFLWNTHECPSHIKLKENNVQKESWTPHLQPREDWIIYKTKAYIRSGSTGSVKHSLGQTSGPQHLS